MLRNCLSRRKVQKDCWRRYCCALEEWQLISLCLKLGVPFLIFWQAGSIVILLFTLGICWSDRLWPYSRRVTSARPRMLLARVLRGANLPLRSTPAIIRIVPNVKCQRFLKWGWNIPINRALCAVILGLQKRGTRKDYSRRIVSRFRNV